MPGLDAFFCTKSRKPRAVILARPGVRMWSVPEFTTRDLATAVVVTEERQIHFASAYLDINEEVE